MRLLPTLLCLCLLIPCQPLRADEAPHARAYLNALNERLDRLADQMPLISKAAQQSAKVLAKQRLNEAAAFGVRGDPGLANELSNRAGSILAYDGRPGAAGDVILYVFGLTRTDASSTQSQLINQIDEAKHLKHNGSMVIGIGSSAQLRSFSLLDEAQLACDHWLDNAAPAADGLLLNEQGRRVVPAATVLNAAAAWAFQCELFAAMTRHDRVPVVRQSFLVDTLKKRWQRYGSQAYHHDRWLDPIKKGELGTRYLQGLNDVLLDIGTASWDELARVARRATTTKQRNASVWVRAGGRYLPYHVGGQLKADPGLFTLLTHDGSDPDMPIPGENDYMIAIGQSETAGSYEWGEPELLREAGRGVAWVVNGYNTHRRDMYRKEILLDLWCPYGDGTVSVENYDARLGPVSGVVGEAVLWMIAAQVQGELLGQQAQATTP